MASPFGCQYTRPLTIDHTKVGAVDQSNFTVLVKLANATFATVANGGRIQNPNGYDLIFTSDAAGTTQIPHHIDWYDPVNGVMWAWVKIGTISHTADTVFYVWYGSASINSSLENVAGSYDSNYLSVYHLGSPTSLLNLNDAAGFALGDPAGNVLAFNGNVASTTGQVAGAANFPNAVASFLQAPNNSGITSGARTITFYAKWAATSADSLAVQLGTGSVNGCWGIGMVNFSARHWCINGFGAGNDYDTGVVPDTNIHLHQVTYDGVNANHYYLDNVEIGAGFTHVYATAAGPAIIGRRQDAVNPMNGWVDEVQIHKVVRDANWRTCQFNNLSNPTSFISLGTELVVVASFGQIYPPSPVSFSLPSYILNSPDYPPVTPNAMNDEFSNPPLNAIWTVRNSTAPNLIFDAVQGVPGVGFSIDQAIPAAPWEFVAKFTKTQAAFGLYIWDDTAGAWPGNGKKEQFRIESATSSDNKVEVSYWNNPGSFNSNNVQLDVGGPGQIAYLRWNSDGTNFRFYWSLDAICWVLVSTQSKTAWIANGGTRIGVEGDSNTAACQWFRRTL